ncbi:hypothetical protein [Martelella limonii]|uniref:hemerythrin domain-containing protein n=1 Tax=Martelella limonii TaxID=1647649 RepID=UPI0015804478|nr:hypothetical protein [Martelella limonii]
MSNIDFMANTPLLANRYDLYGGVHKGLRRMQCMLLARLGANDFEDTAATEKLLADLKRLLSMAAAHVEHEDREIHAALRARAIDTGLLDEQHDDHREAFTVIANKIAAIEESRGAERIEAGRGLYLTFAAYIADDFAHMHEEETVLCPILWQAYSDAELQAIEMRIIASLPPEENMAFTRMMLPAMNPAERNAMVGGMRQGMPPEVFNAVIEFAIRPSLTEAEFAALQSGLAA